MRSLSPEESELWARVTASIRPLSREPAESPLSEAAPAPAAQPARSTSARKAHAQSPPPRPAPHASATLDSTWDRKLRSGSVEPDRVLDLHGRNLDQAWQAIDDALERAIGGNERVLLLITGHERPGAPPIERGKIRSAVHDWLAASRHAGSIAAVRAAHRRHGGGGSLYIILRKSRSRSILS